MSPPRRAGHYPSSNCAHEDERSSSPGAGCVSWYPSAEGHSYAALSSGSDASRQFTIRGGPTYWEGLQPVRLPSPRAPAQFPTN